MKKFLYTDNEKHRLFKNDFIEVGATGHYWDFCGYIVNRTDKKISLRFNKDDEYVSIDPNNGIGLFNDDNNYKVISYLMGNIKDDTYKLSLYVKNNEYEEYTL